MRVTKPNHDIEMDESLEERLLRENQELKRQLEELRSPAHHGLPTKLWHPSSLTLTAIVVGLTVLIVIAFFAGYLPLQKKRLTINTEAREEAQALPRAEVVEVVRSTRNSELQLPGNIEAITEAPILARADGYLKRRMVDIGDRVHMGQPLAEIEAPELDAQVRQAEANFQQSRAALDQALANLQQGQANLDMAHTTADRWRSLVARGVVSRQENDTYQSQYQSQLANVQALDKAVTAQKSTIAAAEANLARLKEMQSYRIVKAPFDGIVTLRNLDVGALVNAGSTLLFRVAQMGTLRTYLNVPQVSANSIHVGQSASLQVSNLPGRQFPGTVARTSNSLDPNSRTLLVEVHVPNPTGLLLPGMYAQVDLSSPRQNPPLVIPSDALVVHPEGTFAAVVGPNHAVHLQTITVGRDYGDRMEVLSGLHEHDSIIPHPGDLAREGLKVSPVPYNSH